MFNLTPNARSIAALVAILATIAACSRKPANEQTSGGAIDPAVLETGSVSPAGPGVHVTRTDSKSIDRAMKYELTTDNFTRFLTAADSLAALIGRDPTARAYLGNDLTDAGSTEADAGLKWLESNETISNTIQRAGMSVKDYFVASIAIAAAERFINSPSEAPATPTLADNAEFLTTHKSELAHIHALRDNKPGMTVTP